MSKSQPITRNADIEKLSRIYNKTYEFTEKMVELHAVKLPVPRLRTFDDGLDAFISDMSGYYSEEPSLTKQEFTQQCDPNFIVDRVSRGQDISMLTSIREPRYADITELPTDYHTALNVITKANQAFMSLDASLRAKFDNNPALFVDFVSNPENSQALIDMGLATAKPQESSPQAAHAPAKPAEGGGEGA